MPDCIGSFRHGSFGKCAKTATGFILKIKKAVEFNPYLYFDQKAIERRIVNKHSLIG